MQTEVGASYFYKDQVKVISLYTVHNLPTLPLIYQSIVIDVLGTPSLGEQAFKYDFTLFLQMKQLTGTQVTRRMGVAFRPSLKL